MLDTHAIAWLGTGNRKFGSKAAAVVQDSRTPIFVSAVTAYEFADLNRRGRFDADLPLEDLLVALDATVLDFPAACWRIAADLPPIHRDPVDRMLVAHAIHADLTLVTADQDIKRYPVRTLW